MTGDEPGSNSRLASYGWDAQRDEELAALREASPGSGDLRAARVVTVHRGSVRLVMDNGDADGVQAGALRHRIEKDASSGFEVPVVGDWVATTPRTAEGPIRIVEILGRRTAFIRRAAGRRIAAQAIAANIDVVVVATAIAGDLNLRRLERYLALALESGATPLILLTKADLVPDHEPAVRAARSVAGSALVLPISARSGLGLDAFRDHLAPGRTIAILGSSGVGKSTLVNALLEQEVLPTGPVRISDGRGRHVTSGSRLLRLPGGALVVDTPGMRELALWDADAGLEDAFAEIVEEATRCRFADCAHDSEPGCAVRAAVEAGAVDDRRLAGYRKLLREERHAELEHDALARRTERKRWARLVREAARVAAARRQPPG